MTICTLIILLITSNFCWWRKFWLIFFRKTFLVMSFRIELFTFRSTQGHFFVLLNVLWLVICNITFAVVKIWKHCSRQESPCHTVIVALLDSSCDNVASHLHRVHSYVKSIIPMLSMWKLTTHSSLFVATNSFIMHPSGHSIFQSMRLTLYMAHPSSNKSVTSAQIEISTMSEDLQTFNLDRVHKVLKHLLSNGIKHSCELGIIALMTENPPIALVNWFFMTLIRCESVHEGNLKLHCNDPLLLDTIEHPCALTINQWQECCPCALVIV